MPHIHKGLLTRRLTKDALRRAVPVILALAMLTGLPAFGASVEKAPYADGRMADAEKDRANQFMRDEAERRRLEQEKACGSGPRLDPFEVWKGVTGPEEAARFLRRHYKRIGSVEKMVDWFRCQGFRAHVMHGPIAQLLNGERKLDAGFVPEEHGGRLLWRRFLPWPPVAVQDFVIIFDVNGKIREIGVGHTFE